MRSSEVNEDDDRLQWVTPLPPLVSGIAQYSRDFLVTVDGSWSIDAFVERGSASGHWSTVRVLTGRRRTSFDPLRPSVFHIGNSGFHEFAYDAALRSAGALVLHDVVLHHGRFGELLRQGRSAEYKRLMTRRYGEGGRKVAEAVLRGSAPADLSEFPLAEDYIERARVTAVHSEHARSLVTRAVPGAVVERVPMGVPLPALTPMEGARLALGLPQSAFIVASITHVNPHKRLPVVFRALRRLAQEFPEALFVVAGSIAPGINLERLARLYDVERHVRLLGYLTERDARLLARAADACVNLRFPSAGETSASLLRLLGAGRPVIVTEDPSTAEFPLDAVLPVRVDRFEDEVVAEMLLLLARRDDVRRAAGDAARAFIEREHSMSVMVEGYRRVVRRAFSVTLPEVAATVLHESPPRAIERTTPLLQSGAADQFVARSLAELRLGGHDGAARAASRAIIELGLDRE